jgi:hypothetical protein
MAYAKATFTDLKQGMADRHDSGTIPTASATLAFYGRLLNRGVRYCSDKLKLTKETTLTTVSGTIALPDDFIAIDNVFEGQTEYSQIPQTNVPDQDQPYVYWITGNHTDGFSLNTKDDVALTVKYAFRPAEMVNGTDVCIIPDPEAVVAYAYGMLRKSETDPIEDAIPALDECDERLAELEDVKNINDAFSGFTSVGNSTDNKYSWE